MFPFSKLHKNRQGAEEQGEVPLPCSRAPRSPLPLILTKVDNPLYKGALPIIFLVKVANSSRVIAKSILIVEKILLEFARVVQ
jgi:hypothetical protein